MNLTIMKLKRILLSRHYRQGWPILQIDTLERMVCWVPWSGHSLIMSSCGCRSSGWSIWGNSAHMCSRFSRSLNLYIAISAFPYRRIISISLSSNQIELVGHYYSFSVRRTLGDSPNPSLVFLQDSCHSGTGRQGDGRQGARRTGNMADRLLAMWPFFPGFTPQIRSRQSSSSYVLLPY